MSQQATKIKHATTKTQHSQINKYEKEEKINNLTFKKKKALEKLSVIVQAHDVAGTSVFCEKDSAPTVS